MIQPTVNYCLSDLPVKHKDIKGLSYSVARREFHSHHMTWKC